MGSEFLSETTQSLQRSDIIRLLNECRAVSVLSERHLVVIDDEQTVDRQARRTVNRQAAANS